MYTFTRSVARIATVATVLAALAASTLGAGGAAADPAGLPLHGDLQAHAVTGSDCVSPVGSCFAGTFHGSLRGPGAFTGSAVSATSTPNVLLLSGELVIRDTAGDVYCSEEAVLDTTPGSDGAYTFLCIITGGTGKWAGASGYLQSTGTFVAPEGGGTYTGRIVLASAS